MEYVEIHASLFFWCARHGTNLTGEKESSISATQDRSKKEISGRLQDVAVKKIDEQTDVLVGMIGEQKDKIIDMLIESARNRLEAESG